MHEIINIQIGSQSNFLGTHFWNAQESYFTYEANVDSTVDHDISFRPGIGADGSDTYTPRTLVYDVKEAFGTLRQSNALYEALEDDPIHSLRGNPSLIQQPQIPQHPYQQYLELNGELPSLTSANIRFWSDYNRVYYHPRSLVQLQFDTISSSASALSSWTSGVDLFDKEDREHDVLDRDFRYFAEECDQLQGVVMTAGIDNAWGGFASKYLERLRDELGKATIWVWGVDEPVRAADDTRERRLTRVTNSIRSLEALAFNASLYTPLASAITALPGYLHINQESAWETSALQAAMLETSTLPMRLKDISNSRMVLADVEQLFTATAANRKILQGQLAREDIHSLTNGVMTNGISQESEDHRMAEIAQQSDVHSAHDISFLSTTRDPRTRFHLFDQWSVNRGSSLETESSSTGREDPYAPTKLRISSSEDFPASLSSYPKIFWSNRQDDSKDIALQTVLTTDSTVAGWMRNMADMSRRVLPVQEREDISSALRTWADDYIDGWESADDDLEDSE